jgi:hypothetical protein
MTYFAESAAFFGILQQEMRKISSSKDLSVSLHFHKNEIQSMKRYIFILFALVFTLSLQAQGQLSENARISVITISPWSGAVYAVFGHTAVRVQDATWGMDVAFNYGYFDSSQPNFIFNFARGIANYSVEVIEFNRFLFPYMMRELGVVEQVLDLTQDEKQRLFNAMYISALPENRYYLYDFLFDNCVTRPRDMIENYVPGIQYPVDERIQTSRDLIHECVSPFPWLKFGIDLVIGGGADIPITLRDKMFIPIYFQEALAETVVIRNGTASPLVKETNIIFSAAEEESRRIFFTPIVVMVLLLLLSIFISWKQKKGSLLLPKIFDSVLFLAVGLGGVIIFFLMFFSIHPVVNPNWNLVWMNPIALIFVPLFWIKSLRNIVYYYHFTNFTVLTLFMLLLWLIPQQFNTAIIPLLVSLWLRVGTNILLKV